MISEMLNNVNAADCRKTCAADGGIVTDSMHQLG